MTEQRISNGGEAPTFTTRVRLKLLIGPLIAGAILHLGIDRAFAMSPWAFLDFFLVAIMLRAAWNISGRTPNA